MAKVPITDPDYWRRQAAEVRTLAMKDVGYKGTMLKVAQDYVRLANLAEELSDLLPWSK